VFFHLRLAIGLAIDVAIVVDVVWAHAPPSLFEG
jgi:hypothetical protein